MVVVNKTFVAVITIPTKSGLNAGCRFYYLIVITHVPANSGRATQKNSLWVMPPSAGVSLIVMTTKQPGSELRL